MDTGNLFSNLPDHLPEEAFEPLLKTPAFWLERILSQGHSTPKGEWYDQAHDEWVVLLAGSAGLAFEGTPSLLVMHPGDYIRIPAHLRHRVEWTAPDQQTLWLAIHY